MTVDMAEPAKCNKRAWQLLRSFVLTRNREYARMEERNAEESKRSSERHTRQNCRYIRFTHMEATGLDHNNCCYTYFVTILLLLRHKLRGYGL